MFPLGGRCSGHLLERGLQEQELKRGVQELELEEMAALLQHLIAAPQE